MTTRKVNPRSRSRRGATLVAGLVALAVGLSACGSSGSGSSGGSSSSASGHHWTATLRLDYLIEGFTVPEVVAEKKGFYSKRGLDLTVQEGTGSGVTTQQTGTGVATFGEADASTAALYIAKGVPVKSVAVFLQKTPNGLAYIGGKTTLSSPSDVQKKSIGLVQGEAPYWLLQAAMKKNGVPWNSFNKVFMSPTALPGALLAGRIDAMGAFDVGSFETTRLANPNAKFISFADWGVNVLSNGLLAQTSTIQHDPAEVKAFVQGTIEGWQWSLAHPDQAATIAHQAFPASNEKALLAGLKDSQSYLHVPATKGLPLGATTAAQWQQTIKFDSTYAGLSSSKPVSDYYTNSFVQ